MFRAKRFGANTIKHGCGNSISLRSKKPRDLPPDWPERRLRVLERDGYKCRRCNANLRGVFYREVHHIVARARGGSDHMSNLIALCKTCHDRIHQH